MATARIDYEILKNLLHGGGIGDIENVDDLRGLESVGFVSNRGMEYVDEISGYFSVHGTASTTERGRNILFDTYPLLGLKYKIMSFLKRV